MCENYINSFKPYICHIYQGEKVLVNVLKNVLEIQIVYL